MGRRDPTPSPEHPRKTPCRGLPERQRAGAHKHIAAGGEDEQQRVGKIIPQPGATRHDRGASAHMTQDTCGKQVLPSRF